MAAKPRRLNIARRSARSTHSPLCLGEISVIDLKTDKFRHAALLRSKRGVSDSEKGIEHYQIIAQAVQANTVLSQLDRERGGMGPIFVTSHDGFVRNKPRISAAAAIASARVAP